MKKIDILKKGVSLIVGIGTAKIVHDFIEKNVETDSVYQKVTVSAASMSIGGAVSELTSSWTDRQIDELAGFFQKIIDRKNSDTEE